MIADTMASRPRVNLDAAYFNDSYACELGVLSEKQELISELLNF